jgi:hypothetical protein
MENRSALLFFLPKTRIQLEIPGSASLLPITAGLSAGVSDVEFLLMPSRMIALPEHQQSSNTAKLF